MWILDFVLNEWPQLFEESAQILRLLLRLFQFLVEELLAVSQQAYQLLILLLQHFDFLHVLAFTSIGSAPVVARALRLHLLHHVLTSVMVRTALLRRRLIMARLGDLLNERGRAAPMTGLDLLVG